MQHKAKYPHFPLKRTHNRNFIRTLFRLYICILAIFLLSTPGNAEPAHGIAMHGKLKYASDFTHFSYVNPNAKKGGRLNHTVVGTFDCLNPLITNCVAVQQIRNYVYESLLVRALDEPFSLYGLIAEKVEMAEDRSWVAFTINPKARFSDGKPVTVDDVIFSYNLLKNKGRPNHRAYYSKVVSVEKNGNVVKFSFKDGKDREMPLIMGYMPILPKHLIDPDTFERSSLKIPVGSGPYLVTKIESGRNVLFRKNPNYWGNDLQVNRGRFNFDEVRIEYFRDHNTMFEAFKLGKSHYRYEGRPDKWAKAYTFSAMKKGQVVKREIPLAIPSGMKALVFNTRRKIFSDKRVRLALLHLLDGNWINSSLYHGLYTRTQSFFDRSGLSSHGVKADAYELKLLAPYLSQIDKKIIDGTYILPASERGNRQNLRKALRLFKEAGYVLKKGKMVNAKTDVPFRFEILLANREEERLSLSFAQSLKQIGIDVTLRLADAAGYERRKTDFDFDMIQNFWPSSLSPGNEQLFRWSTNSADAKGSFNFPGIKSKAVDDMITALLAAKNRQDFTSSVRALDRVLLSGTYMIPLYHPRSQWVAHWNKLECPKVFAYYGLSINSCWIK